MLNIRKRLHTQLNMENLKKSINSVIPTETPFKNLFNHSLNKHVSGLHQITSTKTVPKMRETKS